MTPPPGFGLVAGPDVEDPLNVVIITTFDTDEYVIGALRAGATGFLLKDAGPQLLVQAIHAAAEGDALIAPASRNRSFPSPRGKKWCSSPSPKARRTPRSRMTST